MTQPDQPPAAPVRRGRPRLDAWGITGFAMAAIAFLPTLAIFLLGFIPDMNPIWWLGIVLLPMVAVIGVISVLLGIIGIVVAVRRGSGYGNSIASIALGVVLFLPMVWVAFGTSV